MGSDDHGGQHREPRVGLGDDGLGGEHDGAHHTVARSSTNITSSTAPMAMPRA